jgi:hypothetical protein
MEFWQFMAIQALVFFAGALGGAAFVRSLDRDTSAKKDGKP